MTQDIVPVIIGSNKGSYSIARAFHEGYGLKSEVVIKVDLGATAYSKIMNKHSYENLLDDFNASAKQFKARINERYPDSKKIIIGSDDWFVEQIIKNRSIFEPDWLVPYVDLSTLERAVDKSSFYQLCEEHHIPHPKSYDIKKDWDQLDPQQPYVVKAANTPVYQNLDFEGKEKVFICHSKQEAGDAIDLIQQAGYDDSIVLQDFIASEQSQQATLTLYRSPHDRQLKLFSFGRIIVEDPTPLALGNYLTILSGECPSELIAQAVKLMDALDWVGFANFDLMFDPSSQEFKFLELNPRLGISNYYVTAAGANVSRFYVEDYMKQKQLDFMATDKQALFNSIPKILIKKVAGQTPYWQDVQACYWSGEVYNALAYPADRHWRRQLYLRLNKWNYLKKFKSVGKI